MAERKQGPVKPPTIDLTARDATAGAEKPARRTGSRRPAAEAVEPVEERVDPVEEVLASEEVSASDADDVPPPQPIPPVPPKPPEPPRRIAEPLVSARTAPQWGMLATAAGVGALLGTALTYILALVVPLPGPVMPNLAPALSAQGDRLTTLEERLGAAETGTLDTKTALDTASSGLADRLAALEAGLAEVRASVPEPTDTTALEVRLRALNSRVDAIAAGASSADAGAIAENIGDLEQGVAALQTAIDAINAKAGSGDTALTTLEAEVAALRTEMETAAAEPEPPAPTPVMPLVVSGLESAFATGRPFATELASLATSEPPVAVDDALALQGRYGPRSARMFSTSSLRRRCPRCWPQSRRRLWTGSNRRATGSRRCSRSGRLAKWRAIRPRRWCRGSRARWCGTTMRRRPRSLPNCRRRWLRRRVRCLPISRRMPRERRWSRTSGRK